MGRKQDNPAWQAKVARNKADQAKRDAAKSKKSQKGDGGAAAGGLAAAAAGAVVQTIANGGC